MAITLLNVDPADGSIIDSNESVTFDVKSAAFAFVRIVVMFTFEGYSFREVAYEGDPAVDGAGGYEVAYSPLSSFSVMESGAPDYRYRFTVRRSPLWPNSPQLSVVAYNTNAEEL